MLNSTLCYIERGEEYLMLHRTAKDNDPNHDKWIGIGGKFEEKESPEDCILREVKEETGLRLSALCYRGLVTFVSDQWETELMHLFTAKSPADIGELSAIHCSEGELAWVKKEAVYSLPIWEGDRLFLRLLEQQTPFFSLKLVYQGDALTSAVLNGEVIR